ncbi:hypothetical protein BSLG_005004 [Batrachochytrium salamandrivorans]|nr:hypothetical protein BSLG_005004 [Batrachochytrium salamandrivorans]
MIFPALLILLVSFCQVVMGLFCSRSGSISPGEFGAPFFMCLDSTVPFTTDPRKVPPLLLSGLCNAARTAVEKLTSACLSIREKYQQEKEACKAARAHKLHLEKMVKDADQDTMESKEGSFDARLNLEGRFAPNFRMLSSWQRQPVTKLNNTDTLDECVGKCKKDKKAAGLKVGVIMDKMLNLEEVVRLGNGIDDVTASKLIKQAKQRFEKILGKYKSSY